MDLLTMISRYFVLCVVTIAFSQQPAWSFQCLLSGELALGHSSRRIPANAVVSMSNGRNNESEEKYINPITGFLSNFMEKESRNVEEDPLAKIDFNVPKLSPKLDLQTMAAVLDYELYNREWFVTGDVLPMYFANNFQFQDPDVQLTGIEEYARGVNKLFDQRTARAEIISTVVNTTVPNTITCTWRLSGKVNIGPTGITIKPYIVYTDFTIDSNSGLIVFQEDRFSVPGWDILLSGLFPFLVEKTNLLSPPAPPILEPRKLTMPAIGQPPK